MAWEGTGAGIQTPHEAMHEWIQLTAVHKLLLVHDTFFPEVLFMCNNVKQT